MFIRNIKQDFIYLKSQISILESIPSYNLFTKRQKQILYLSIYIYLRSLRSQTNNWEKFLPAKHNDPYKPSVDFNNRMTCLSSVQSVDEGKIIFSNTADYSDSFFHGNYTKKQVRQFKELEDHLKSTKFPSIIHIATKPERKLMPHHEFLYLGKNKDGIHIAWEKVLPGLEFHVTTLQSIFQLYPSQYWGISPLQSTS